MVDKWAFSDYWSLCFLLFLCWVHTYCHKLVVFQFNNITHSNIHPLFILKPGRAKRRETVKKKKSNGCCSILRNLLNQEMGKIWTGKLSDVMTHEPRMRTWDWRLFTWLSLLWRNWRWQKVTCSRNTDSYLCLWCMKTYSRSHPWHPLLQWCSAPELKARWWWTRRGRRSEVSTKHRETKLIMQITFKMEHKGSVRYRDSYV